jgi:CheY-like chemotaxis protein/signal transduction histidine kinase
MELATLARFSEINVTFLEQLTGSIGIVLNTITATMRTEELLKQSQALTEELQSQQEELTETNRRLEAQAKTLQQSEELLRRQQEELQQANEELEERATLLTEQKAQVETKNSEVESARQDLQQKAEQLALTSKYKSEFLANMSHELRTPLNSLLILSQMLAQNGDGTLTPKQIEYATTVHSAGTDLLALINDILDLVKIESGTMTVEIAELAFSEIKAFAERTFRHIAEDRGLTFTIDLQGKLPRIIRTDAKRLLQVLKNLLSNAFKFTEEGGVRLEVALSKNRNFQHANLLAAQTVVCFAVIDTGIGIAGDKHAVVFEAFQQVDGSTSRHYGGTGLGLSISREIASMLGGEISLESAPGAGSAFRLFLPIDYLPKQERTSDRANGLPRSSRMRQSPMSFGGDGRMNAEVESATYEEIIDVADDRNDIEPGDRVLLVVEDDPTFARIMRDLGHIHDFKVVIASSATRALAYTKEFKPSAITLDLCLPDYDGWTVLDRLKHDPTARHIPVHVISVVEERQRAVRQGAIAYLQKPATKESLEEALSGLRSFVEQPMRRLLVVEDDDAQRQSIIELIGNSDVKTTAAASGKEALEAVRNEVFDCMVLDLKLPDMSGFELLEQLKREPKAERIRVVIYTGKELSLKEEAELRRVAEAIVIKDVRSPERLFDETALFLHRVEAELPPPKRKLLEQLKQFDPVLAGRSVLIVDDDYRNLFALTTMLEIQNMVVQHAENGSDAIRLLESGPDLDIVLMDVMMPRMDGYETMRQIRANPRFTKLPILAVTAKAMKGDREKCIEAGASDYITKPIDSEQLLSLLRVWLYR